MNCRKAVGIISIILGVVLCVGLITYQYIHCVDMWNNTYKNREYTSALEYFLEVSNGAIFISVAAGVILVITGGGFLGRSVLMNPGGIVAFGLILLGAAICAIGISVNLAHFYERYQGFAEHGYYDSFWHYYWAVGKANAFFSVVCGGIPIAAGILLIRKM